MRAKLAVDISQNVSRLLVSVTLPGLFMSKLNQRERINVFMLQLKMSIFPLSSLHIPSAVYRGMPCSLARIVQAGVAYILHFRNAHVI